MKKREIKILALVVLLPLMSCERNNDLARTLTYDFANDEEGWTADFADYPVGEADAYELHADYASLPSPLSQSKGAFLQRGNNQSDDLYVH